METLPADLKERVLDIVKNCEQEFRKNSMAHTPLAELLHHAKRDGKFDDKQLDEAAISLMSGTELKDAQTRKKGSNYREGRVGHKYINDRCKPTNANGPPPKR